MSLICARCLEELVPGSGDFYVVRIAAVADPASPAGDCDEQSLRDQLDELFRQVSQLSEREAMDQVMRQLTMHLCASCFHIWIENPAGSP